MTIRTKRNKGIRSSACSIYILTIAINIIIPKAGIKLAGIPLTLGNILLAVSLVTLFFRKNGSLDGTHISKCILIGMVFWIIRIVPFVGKVGLNEIVGQLTALVIYPLSYYVAKEYLKHKGTNKIEKVIQVGCCIIMLYGLIQFFLGIGRVDIPGITVNYSDYINNPISWWEEKYNSFGSSSKIVSTYQNGNVFGCSLLLLFPVSFRAHYKKDIYRYAVFALYLLTIVLTGSRSCLIGCLIYIVILVYKAIKTRKIKRRILISVIAIMILCIPLAVKWLSNPSNTELIDRMFGTNITAFLQGSGRTNTAMMYFGWLSNHMWAILIGGLGANYVGGAYEMTYIAVFVMGGIIGLAIYLLPFTKILKRCRRGLKQNKDPMLIAVREGMIIYFITAFLEGAYWLPPTAINVWMICALGVHLSSGREALPRMLESAVKEIRK